MITMQTYSRHSEVSLPRLRIKVKSESQARRRKRGERGKPVALLYIRQRYFQRYFLTAPRRIRLHSYITTSTSRLTTSSARLRTSPPSPLLSTGVLQSAKMFAKIAPLLVFVSLHHSFVSSHHVRIPLSAAASFALTTIKRPFRVKCVVCERLASFLCDRFTTAHYSRFDAECFLADKKSHRGLLRVDLSGQSSVRAEPGGARVRRPGIADRLGADPVRKRKVCQLLFFREFFLSKKLLATPLALSRLP